MLPLAGMADWGLGHPLDAEETALMHVLRDACALVKPDRKPLVLPPMRFAFGADKSCAFAVDPPTAHSMIAEVAASVAAAGFRKIAIINSSPWNEELCSAAARDLRVSRGLHMFHIHLSALELDFHPARSRSRRRVQTLLPTALYGAEPEMPPRPPACPIRPPSRLGRRIRRPAAWFRGAPREGGRGGCRHPCCGGGTGRRTPLGHLGVRAAGCEDHTDMTFPDYGGRYLPAMTLSRIRALLDG